MSNTQAVPAVAVVFYPSPLIERMKRATEEALLQATTIFFNGIDREVRAVPVDFYTMLCLPACIVAALCVPNLGFLVVLADFLDIEHTQIPFLSLNYWTLRSPPLAFAIATSPSSLSIGSVSLSTYARA